MIGNIYKRRASAPADYPARVRITAQLDSNWIVTDAEQFGATFALSPADLAKHYAGAPRGPGRPPGPAQISGF